MMTTDTTTTTTKRALIACECGKRHREGTVCATAERLQRQRVLADTYMEALRRLPAGVVTLLDDRDGRARSRTLSDGEALVWAFSDATVDTEWGSTIAGSDGTTLRYQRECGGYVANSHGYPADADWVHVLAADGRVLVLASRYRTRSSPYGKGAASDELPPLARVREAAHQGERYCAAWVFGCRLRWLAPILVGDGDVEPTVRAVDRRPRGNSEGSHGQAKHRGIEAAADDRGPARGDARGRR